MDEPVLCFVEGSWAWFVTPPLSNCHGADFNDAPYEDNASEPFAYDPEWGPKDGYTPYTLTKVAFDVWAYLPHESPYGSYYSVDDINIHKAVAWLRLRGGSGQEMCHLWAGTPLSEFIRQVEAFGGTVYLAKPRDED